MRSVASTVPASAPIDTSATPFCKVAREAAVQIYTRLAKRSERAHRSQDADCTAAHQRLKSVRIGLSRADRPLGECVTFPLGLVHYADSKHTPPVDPATSEREGPAMQLSGRNQDIYKALLAQITGDIKSSPRLREFRKATKEPLKLSGLGKLNIPVVVWDALLVDEALTAEWDVSIEGGDGSSPEFTMNKR